MQYNTKLNTVRKNVGKKKPYIKEFHLIVRTFDVRKTDYHLFVLDNYIRNISKI